MADHRLFSASFWISSENSWFSKILSAVVRTASTFYVQFSADLSSRTDYALKSAEFEFCTAAGLAFITDGGSLTLKSWKKLISSR